MTRAVLPQAGATAAHQPATTLAEVLEANQGQILIHCGYGPRAAYLWLAYLIEHEGLTLDQALERGEAMMLKPHPIGRLLGRPTTLVFVEKAPALSEK